MAVFPTKCVPFIFTSKNIAFFQGLKVIKKILNKFPRQN